MKGKTIQSAAHLLGYFFFVQRFFAYVSACVYGDVMKAEDRYVGR